MHRIMPFVCTYYFQHCEADTKLLIKLFTFPRLAFVTPCLVPRHFEVPSVSFILCVMIDIFLSRFCTQNALLLLLQKDLLQQKQIQASLFLRL